jgi:hypothetical protein
LPIIFCFGGFPVIFAAALHFSQFSASLQVMLTHPEVSSVLEAFGSLLAFQIGLPAIPPRHSPAFSVSSVTLALPIDRVACNTIALWAEHRISEC